MSTTAPRLLLVDDEAYVRDSLAAVLSRRGYAVRTASNVQDALRESELEGLDAVVTDLRMSGESGLDLLRKLHATSPSLPIVVLTGHGTVASAVECVQAGAADYLSKPIDPDALILAIERVIRDSRTRRELDYLRERGGSTPAGAENRLIGRDPAWLGVLHDAKRAAQSNIPVLIQGESGTGKEELARYIHRHSERVSGPLVSVNCAAIPVDLFESEFFGHRRGAFTGALEDRVGRWMVADGGTLFLDEINSLPPLAQPKVLRALQDGVFERVGESRSCRADVRVVCASNVSLESEVEAGRFRSDLFYRINVLTLKIPPLRERLGDVADLAHQFLHEISLSLGRPVPELLPDALAALTEYRWPGNVRELRNVLERGLLLSDSATFDAGCLPPDLRSKGDATPASAGASAPPVRSPGSADDGDLNLRNHLRDAEGRLLEEALRRAGGVRRKAARLLGIDERNLSYYLRKHRSRSDEEADADSSDGDA